MADRVRMVDFQMVVNDSSSKRGGKNTTLTEATAKPGILGDFTSHPLKYSRKLMKNRRSQVR